MTDATSVEYRQNWQDQEHNFVVGFMTNDKDVILIQKKRPKWQEGKLNGVGGRVKVTEPAVYAMVREFYEETGALTRISDWELKVILINHSVIVRFFWCNLLDKYNNAIESMTDEHVVPVSKELLPRENCIPNLRWIIPLCCDNDIGYPVMVNDVQHEGNE